MVGCDRVVCPLVLHATTIAHLDVLLCTLLCFLLCAVLLCGAVPPVLWCALCLACPACGVSAWCCVCGVWVRHAPLLSLLLRVCATVRPVLPVPCLPYFLGIIPALYMGCYMWALYAPYMRALFFRFGIYDPFCTHSKSRPLDSECGFPKVGLNFRCSVFLLWNFPGKISGLIFP